MLCVHNALHLDAKVDLLLDQGKIVTMLPAGHQPLPEHCEIFDASGLLLLPGLIDCHAHLRDPGFEYKEDIASGLTAAAHGGFCAVMCMANTKPVNDTAAVTRYMLDRAKSAHPHGPDLFPIAAATIGLEGREIAPLAELAQAGCIAVSNDGKPVASSEICRRVMEYAWDVGLRFIDHCEDPTLAAGWLMNEGVASGSMGVKGQPAAGEAIQAARDIMLAEYLRIPVHIAHVSSKLTLDLIAWGKNRGIDITCETCPHYLLLDESIYNNYNTLAKVSPPIRTIEDRDALRQAARNGLIDILATDHAPHANHEKNVTLDEAPFGISGFDLALPLCFELVETGVLAEADLHRLWAKRPAEIFNLKANEFMPGDPASFILYDPELIWEVNEQAMYSKSSNTPFLGRKMKGRVRHNWIRGQQLF